MQHLRLAQKRAVPVQPKSQQAVALGRAASGAARVDASRLPGRLEPAAIAADIALSRERRALRSADSEGAAQEFSDHEPKPMRIPLAQTARHIRRLRSAIRR